MDDSTERRGAPAGSSRARPAIRRGWLRALLFLPAWGVAVLSFSALTLIEPGVLSGWEVEAGRLVVSSLVVPQSLAFLGSLLAVFLFRRLIDGRSVRSLGLELARKGRHLAAGLVAGAAAIGIGFLILYASGSLAIVPGGGGPGPGELAAAIALFAMVALEEELVVRGYVLSNLCASMNRYAAVAVSSALFAAAHLFNLNLSAIGIVNIALAGALFGIYYVRFRNLWFPVGLHFTWNLFQGPVFGFGVSGLPTASLISHEVSGPGWLTGGEFGLEGSVIATGLEVLLIGFVILLGKSRAGVESGIAFGD